MRRAPHLLPSTRRDPGAASGPKQCQSALPELTPFATGLPSEHLAGLITLQRTASTELALPNKDVSLSQLPVIRPSRT